MFKPASRLASVAALCALIVPQTGFSATIQWTLTDVLFDDGGTATGSFVYDADTNTFSAINISTSGGVIAPASFSDALYGDATNAGLVDQIVADFSGEPLLQLIFQTPLTNAGGFVDLTFINPSFSSFEFMCGDAGCIGGTIQRTMIDGGLIGVPAIPLPPAAFLMASALGLLGAFRRRSGRN